MTAFAPLEHALQIVATSATGPSISARRDTVLVRGYESRLRGGPDDAKDSDAPAKTASDSSIPAVVTPAAIRNDSSEPGDSAAMPSASRAADSASASVRENRFASVSPTTSVTVN